MPLIGCVPLAVIFYQGTKIAIIQQITKAKMNVRVNISDDEKVFVSIEQKTNENEVVKYQYDNHLGSACLELDTNANIISYEEYHPFGTTSYRSGRSETEVSLKRYKYNGKERDEETGLYMYGMRYYASWLCRFVSVDPLQHEYPHYTPYQYAGNKPITYIDLDGTEPSKMPESIQNDMRKNIKRLPKIERIYTEKITNPLLEMHESEEYSFEDIQAEADFLAEMYQAEKWFKMSYSINEKRKTYSTPHL